MQFGTNSLCIKNIDEQEWSGTGVPRKILGITSLINMLNTYKLWITCPKFYFYGFKYLNNILHRNMKLKKYIVMQKSKKL